MLQSVKNKKTLEILDRMKQKGPPPAQSYVDQTGGLMGPDAVEEELDEMGRPIVPKKKPKKVQKVMPTEQLSYE